MTSGHGGSSWAGRAAASVINLVPGRSWSSTKDREDLRNAVAASAQHHRGVTAEWRRHDADLRRALRYRHPDRFLRWRLIRKTMFVGGRWARTGYVETELQSLSTEPDFSAILAEDVAGCPYLYSVRPRTSANRIHQAYHLHRFRSATGTQLQHADLVVEFGGGYGGMCRIMRLLGFEGTYVIYDLEVLSALQRFYLRGVGSDAHPLTEPWQQGGTFTVSSLEELRSVVSSTGGSRAFIATWSLSESPPDLQRAVLAQVSTFDCFLLAYQERFGSIDNVSGLAAVAKQISRLRWTDERIDHLSGNHYLFGVRTGEET